MHNTLLAPYQHKSERWQQIYIANRSPNRFDANPTPEQAEILKSLQHIIESVYTDGIEAIKSYSLDPKGDIKVIFRDGQKIYTCLITDDRISYHEIQPNAPKLDSLAVPEYRFDVVGVAGVPRTPKKKNCTKGDSCGFTCVKKGTCKKGLTPEVKAEVTATKEKIKGELASRGKAPKEPKVVKGVKPKVVKEKVVKEVKEPKPKVVKEKVVKETKPKAETKSQKTATTETTKEETKKTTNQEKSTFGKEKLSFVSDSDFHKVGDANWHEIDFVKDSSGKTYAKRQNANFSGVVDFDTASELLAGEVARSAGLDNFSKLKVQNPTEAIAKGGVVHNYSEFVPGITYAEAKKTGQIKNEHENLTLSNEKSLDFALSHPDLAKIYAFDLHSFNGDRYEHNFMYDKKSDRYYAIDNEAAFYGDPDKKFFGEYYLGYMRNAVEKGLTDTLSKPQLSDNEKANLKVFHDTLTSLQKRNPSETITRAEEIRKQISTPSDKEYEFDNLEQRTKAVTNTHAYVNSLLSKYKDDFKRLGIN